jgi:hypothetical protein
MKTTSFYGKWDNKKTYNKNGINKMPTVIHSGERRAVSIEEQ